MVPNPSRLIRSARRLASTDAGAPFDTELLQRYAAGRDEEAFAELVRRNGPVVLRVCRNALGEAGADDAFQATFLLLARSAERLARPGSLAGWLHAAAVRVARAARRADERRRRREATPRPRPAAADDLSWREVREILDAEIAALPEHYRLPVVLCCVQELGYEDAAREVGCPVGALRGRLERARDRLRRRLARYGLPLAAPVLVGASPPPADGAAIDRVVALVRAAEVGTLPPAVAALLRAAGRPKATLLLVPVAAVLVAVGLVAAAAAPQAPAPAEPPTAKQPAATAARAGDQFGDRLPAGAVARLGTRRSFGPYQPRWVAFSPDGLKVAAGSYYGLTVLDVATGRRLVERTGYGIAPVAAGWRADGTGVAVVRVNGHHIVSAFTDTAEKLPDPPAAPPGRDRAGPDGLDFVALAPDATRLAVVRTPDAARFTVDVLPATVGRLVADLQPARTLGPFRGPCREVRFTTLGVQVLTGALRGEDDWTLTVIDPDRNVVVRTTTLPPPAYCVWGYMYSLSADGRFAALPVRPATVKEGQSFTNAHDRSLRVWDLEAGRE
ncbi:MAG TPA: sigma-70 family RNA polymerase sigma factor, partial [Urbifossiella sp.]|nr:sigma-70 family RNA polymerase sigma factor [Urbifossiella sp.]